MLMQQFLDISHIEATTPQTILQIETNM